MPDREITWRDKLRYRFENTLWLGTTVDFYTVLEAAAQRGETAIGYRLMKYADDKDHGYGVNVSPKKSEKHTFTERDKIVVLAEDG